MTPSGIEKFTKIIALAVLAYVSGWAVNAIAEAITRWNAL
mgnify:CR=1 FL=1